MIDPAAFLHQCSTYLIEREGQIAEVVVPDGMRMVMMMRGHTPLLAPIDEPGCYEIDGDDISPEGNAFPVAIAVVDLGHVKAWLGMDVAVVGRLMDGIEALQDPEQVPP